MHDIQRLTCNLQRALLHYYLLLHKRSQKLDRLVGELGLQGPQIKAVFCQRGTLRTDLPGRPLHDIT